MARSRTPFLLSILVVFLSANPSDAQTSQAERLKAELEALRLEFSNRIAELEARLKAVEGATSAASTPAPSPVGAPPPAPPAPIGMAPASSSKIFNPDIAAMGDFVGALGKSPGGGEPSLEFHEAEVSLQAVVDP